jgi:hypothetical protein
MKYGIVTTYYASFSDEDIDLDDKTWNDVEWWHIKWGVLHVKIKDESCVREFTLSEDYDGGGIDWKRPAEAQIFELDGDGSINWDEEVDSSGG